ncbi:MAG: hypothetical protein FJZ09_06010 [Candidatus Omnitrophica bacterium]|nr:hypothetical protein [Candidatus Omnitrophota bacterium]
MSKERKNEENVPEAPLGDQPGILSLRFHIKFFPEVLRRCFLRRKSKGQEYQSPFANHFPIEFTLAIIFCVVLLVAGLPGLIGKRSLISGAMSLLGAGGLIAMLVSSIRSENKNRAELGGRYTFDYFVTGVFLFFLLLGLSAGISLGYLKGSPAQMVLYGLTGIAAGYIVGLFAGIGINYLGWFGTYVVYLFYFLMIFLVLFDIILICIFVFSGRQSPVSFKITIPYALVSLYSPV